MHVSSEMTKANSPIFNIRINARSRVEKWGDFEKPTLQNTTQQSDARYKYLTTILLHRLFLDMKVHVVHFRSVN